MKPTHENIIKFISTIRESFCDSTIVYQFGCCYQFYKILDCVFGAEAYSVNDNDHIVSKINGRFYDINGEYIYSDGIPREGAILLDKTRHEYWERVGRGLRTEIMVQKQSNSYQK